MFTDKKERFCIPGLCGGEKTIGIHSGYTKKTLMWTQKRLKTGKKDVVKKFLLPSH
jgi:hypothetical protein